MLPSWLLEGEPGTEFYTDERVYITELLNAEQSPGVSLAVARVESGVTTQLHALRGVDEIYIIREGSGVVEVNHVAQPVKIGDKVLIAAGTPQRITNTGAGDLVFYCLCLPRFTPGCYLNLEE